MAGIGAELSRALQSVLGTRGLRVSAGPTSGITRTRHFDGRCEVYGITVMPDQITAAAAGMAFWSLDDSNVSASGSAGAAVIGGFIYQSTAAPNSQAVDKEFLRPILFENGLTFNYTATGTGCQLRYSIWYSPLKDRTLG